MVTVNFYFIHAKWLSDRQRIIDEFKKTLDKFTFRTASIGKIEVIEELDPSDITGDFTKNVINYSALPDQTSIYNGMLKNLHVHQLSNNVKHLKAIQAISQCTDESAINIVLEDDILYENRICLLIEKLVRSIPSDYDIVFLGMPTNKQVENQNELNYQDTSEVFKVLPYCDSYVISKKAAKQLVEAYLPIKFLTNIQLSYLIEKLQLKSQLVYPNLFMDGTKVGNFVSALNPNNVVMFNNDYNIAKTLTGKDSLTPEETQQLETVFTSSAISEHPDMGYIKAKYLEKNGRYVDARTVYEQTYEKYKKNNAIINHESAFLKDYIKVFKNLQ